MRAVRDDRREVDRRRQRHGRDHRRDRPPLAAQEREHHARPSAIPPARGRESGATRRHDLAAVEPPTTATSQ